MEKYVHLIIGIALVGLYVYLLSDKVSTKIRNSDNWFIGWIGALLILALGGSQIIIGIS